MSIPLRVLADQGLMDGTEPETSPPEPFQSRVVTFETRDGVDLHTFHMWFVEDALRCRACPAAECTFRANSCGVGSCHVRGPMALPRTLHLLAGG